MIKLLAARRSSSNGSQKKGLRASGIGGPAPRSTLRVNEDQLIGKKRLEKGGGSGGEGRFWESNVHGARIRA